MTTANHEGFLSGLTGWLLGVGQPTEQQPPEPDVRDMPQAVPSALPRSFEEYVNQEEAKRVLQTAVRAAKRTGATLPHVMLYGPPGVGKSAMAHVLAQEMGGLPLYVSTGAEFPNQTELLRTFARIGEWHLQERRSIVWLIDEIDGIPRVASYALHSLMEHGYVTWEGHRYGGVPLTVVGTTNHAAAVPMALFGRFQVVAKLDYYLPGDLTRIAVQSAKKRGIGLSAEAAEYIGLNAGGEPRKVNRMILTNLENTLVGWGGSIKATLEDARAAIELSGLRLGGLSKDQVGYLEFLSKMPNLTAGLAGIAAYLSEPPKTIQFYCEPFLIRSELVMVTRGGRMLTNKGKEYLNVVSNQ